MNKSQLIAAVQALTADYTITDLKAMKVGELEDLLVDIKSEELNAEPEVNDAGEIVIPEQVVVTEAVIEKVVKEAKVKAPSKRDELFAIFDKAFAAGETNYAEQAQLAQPETSKGVVSSYLCYWRADRNVSAVKATSTKVKASNGAKALAAITKIFGTGFVMADVMKEMAEAYTEESAALEATLVAEESAE